MPHIAKKQALACVEALLVAFELAHDKVDAARMLMKFTGHSVVLAALAVRVSDAAGAFPDIYESLRAVDEDFARSYAAEVYQFDQMRKRAGKPSLPVQFDGHGASNVIYLADWRARRAA